MPPIPFRAREVIVRLAAIQKEFEAGGDAVALLAEHRRLYRELRDLGLTEVQIETALRAAAKHV